MVFGALFYSLFITYKQKRRLQLMAFYHNLTGLPNRRYLEAVLAEKVNLPGKRALLLIHFRNFNAINHNVGFHYGDQVLSEISKTLSWISSEEHKLFHFSGSRFALLVDNYATKEELENLIEKIHKLLTPANGIPHQISVRIGVVEITDKSKPEQIITNASLALLNSAEPSKHYSFFCSEMEDKLQRDNRIERELRRDLAIPEAHALYLEYQPIVNLKTQEIVAFEALARMNSPELGFVSPLEFISIAEQRKLIIPLGRWVLRGAAAFSHKLATAGYPHVRVAVNVSVTELLQRNFPSQLQKILTEFNIKPNNLELEITESVIIYNFKAINTLFQQLRELGIKIAVDDFGTGYSSFSRVTELNIDILKIDKQFIDQITCPNQGKVVLNNIITMAHELNLEVVAEGVETTEQMIYLAEHGCDRMQGYLFSRPLQEAAALAKLQESTSKAL